MLRSRTHLAPAPPPPPHLQSRIKEHYDLCSPQYQDLWGKHIHHGLWRPGQEGLSKEDAQEKLVEEMYARARLPQRAKVLDIGCGVGGTSCYLAARGHDVTGVSLSTTQITMAKENMAKEGVTVRFLEMDAEKISFPGEDGTFDAVWISEAMSHFPNKDKALAHAVRLLKPGGKIVIVDWCVGVGFNHACGPGARFSLSGERAVVFVTQQTLTRPPLPAQVCCGRVRPLAQARRRCCHRERHAPSSDADRHGLLQFARCSRRAADLHGRCVRCRRG